MPCEDEVDESCAENADTCVGECLCLGKPSGHAHLHYGCIAPEECEGRSQEGRHFQFGAEMEDESSETCEEQGCGHGETCDYRYEDGGSEHCEHVLESQGEHLPTT